MPLEYEMFDSPKRAEYLGNETLDTLMSTSYGRKVYATTSNPSNFNAVDAGNFSYLLLANGTDKLLLTDGTSKLLLASSSGQMTSLIYLFSESEPLLLGGVSTGQEGGSDLEDLSLVFPRGFFQPGQVAVFEASGSITENAANTSLVFTITFPDDGTAATASMPATVGQDELTDWTLKVICHFGIDTLGNGVVSLTGELTVSNSGATNGQSQTLLTSVINTFDYQDVLFFKPQVSWSAQNAGSSTDFHSSYFTVT